MADTAVQQVTGTLKQCADRYGVERTTFWRWMKRPGAPKPIQNGNVSRWYFAEVDEYLRPTRAGRQSRRVSG